MCVSPQANISYVTHDSMHHNLQRELLQMRLRSRSGVMHTRWPFKQYANARASLNVNEALPSLTQRTENHERIHMRYRSSTGYVVCYGKRLDPPVYTDFTGGRWQMAQKERHYFRFVPTKTGSRDAKLPTFFTKHDVVDHRSGQTADT